MRDHLIPAHAGLIKAKCAGSSTFSMLTRWPDASVCAIQVCMPIGPRGQARRSPPSAPTPAHGRRAHAPVEIGKGTEAGLQGRASGQGASSDDERSEEGGGETGKTLHGWRGKED